MTCYNSEVKFGYLIIGIILLIISFFSYSSYGGDLYNPTRNLSGSWRPFSDDSPWNTPISQSAEVHGLSQIIINNMNTAVKNIRFGNKYLIPVWVVDANKMKQLTAKASYPFDIWDCNNDFITDIEVPINSSMWGEQTEDGHIVIIDTVFNFSWEMSRFKGIVNDTINCSTFNIWDLAGNGVGNPNEGKRWKSRGGRGSGFPNIAGLIRPEEIKSGEIRHALAFTYSRVKKNDFYIPACRSDGNLEDDNVPAEGMLFQLNPQLTDSDFEDWGLSAGAKVVARALQKYGMYLCDRGGDMALQLQLLDADSGEHRKKWDEISPGLYTSVNNIPTNQFRLIYTGEPVSGGTMDVVTTPLIIPPFGNFKEDVKMIIKINQLWPEAAVRYTLDDSDPSEDSFLYNGPLLIKKSTTIKAIAFDPSGKKSPIMRAQIFIKSF